jgi:hypothetical protein
MSEVCRSLSLIFGLSLYAVMYALIFNRFVVVKRKNET